MGFDARGKAFKRPKEEEEEGRRRQALGRGVDACPPFFFSLPPPLLTNAAAQLGERGVWPAERFARLSPPPPSQLRILRSNY